MEYVECGTCNSTFIPRVLDSPQSHATQSVGEGQTQSIASSNDDFMAIYEKAIRHSMVLVMLADGVIDSKEKEQVLKIINKFGHNDLTMSELDVYIENVKLQDEDVATYLEKVGPQLNEHGKETVIKVALSVANADGIIDDSELRLITRMANAMEMSSSHLRGIISDYKEKHSISV